MSKTNLIRQSLYSLYNRKRFGIIIDFIDFCIEYVGKGTITVLDY